MSRTGPNQDSDVPALYTHLAKTAVPKSEVWEYALWCAAHFSSQSQIWLFSKIHWCKRP